MVGQSFRHTWTAYAGALLQNRAAKFLADSQITSAHRENVEAAIGTSTVERFQHVRSVVFALWRRRCVKQSTEVFATEWSTHAKSIMALCEWLGTPELETVFAAVPQQSEEQACIALIGAAGVSVDEWQRARGLLQLEPWKFSRTARGWENAIRELTATLMVCAARSTSDSLPDAETLLRPFAICDIPAELHHQRADDVTIARAVLKEMNSRLITNASEIAAVFLRRCSSIEAALATSISEVTLTDAPRRDATVYIDDDEPKRARDAEARFDAIVRIAIAVAAHLAESISEETIRANPRVSPLLTGWWANCFCIIPALQRALQSVAPKTSQRLSDCRVYRDPAPANEMRTRFEELQNEPGPSPPPPPKRQVTVFGQVQPEDDVANDLQSGSSGIIGKHLQSVAEQCAAVTASPTGRQQVTLAKRGDRARGTPTFGLGRGSESRKDADLSGLIGEIFVYELFRKLFPDFDERAWQSENRQKYGLEGAGSDALGYDFSYRDVKGKLTTRTDKPMCYIEVKATTTDGSDAFPISANEWEKARECHLTSDTVYIIVRVANVREAPRISDMIYDPFGLYRIGQVALISDDMRMYVGRPLDPSR